MIAVELDTDAREASGLLAAGGSAEAYWSVLDERRVEDSRPHRTSVSRGYSRYSRTFAALAARARRALSNGASRLSPRRSS